MKKGGLPAALLCTGPRGRAPLRLRGFSVNFLARSEFTRCISVYLSAKAPAKMGISAPRANYQLGSFYSLVTAALLATQEPFSRWRPVASVPPIHMHYAVRPAVIRSAPDVARRQPSRFHRLAVGREELGKAGDFIRHWSVRAGSYNIGLSSAHPIITAAILNLLRPFGRRWWRS